MPEDPNYFVIDAKGYTLSKADTPNGGDEWLVYGVVSDDDGGFIAYCIDKGHANLIANTLNAALDPS